MVGALRGVDQDTLLSPDYYPSEGLWEQDPLAARIACVADGSFKHRHPPDIKGTGYVVDSLEATLWAFHRSDGFREGALFAVNLGDDADTTAGDLRTDRRRRLRSRDDSSLLAVQADDGDGHHVASRPPPRPSRPRILDAAVVDLDSHPGTPSYTPFHKLAKRPKDQMSTQPSRSRPVSRPSGRRLRVIEMASRKAMLSTTIQV